MGSLMEGEFLQKKEVKKLFEKVEEQWGTIVVGEYLFFKNNKRKIYVVNREFAQIERDKLRINSIGMYFCEATEKGDVRLSIEGSQMLGPTATKNVLEVNEKQAKEWLYGEDVAYEGESSGFVILRYENYFIGCGKHKEGYISNHVSKNRRIGTKS